MLVLKSHVVLGEQRWFHHLIVCPTLAQPSCRALPLLILRHHLKPELIHELDGLQGEGDHIETWSRQYQLVRHGELHIEST